MKRKPLHHEWERPPSAKRCKLDLMEVDDDEDHDMNILQHHQSSSSSDAWVWRKLITECKDVWIVIISFLDTRSWLQLSYTCHSFNEFKYDQLVMAYKKKSIQRFLDVKNGIVFESCYLHLYNIDLNCNASVNDQCFQFYFHNLISLTMFSFNNNSSVTNNAFQYLTNLRYLDISWCGRSSISNLAFHNLRNLQVLDISGCERTITDEAFSHLKSLHTLTMSRCGQITSRAFQYFSNLIYLDMSYCDQPTITDEAFLCLKRIQNLNVRGCTQSTLTDEILYYMRGSLRRFIADARKFSRASLIIPHVHVTLY